MLTEYLVFDYETFSEADLKKVGAWEYSTHSSTELLCLAYRFGNRSALSHAPTKWWVPGKDISEFIKLLLNPNIILTAHNSFFEKVITQNVLPRYVKVKIDIPSSRWLCTATQAAALALPRNLENAAIVLQLPVQKDMAGRKLMLKWSKPRKPTKNNPSTRHTDPAELARIVEYCKKDVAAEVELFLATPELHPLERKVWLLDQEINLRGFAVDRPLVKTVLGMIDAETQHINEKTSELSFGALYSTTQREGVLDFLQQNGVFLPDLRKATVDEAISAGMVTGVTKEILEYRQAISMTSTAKYEVFEARSRYDGRLRDILLFHAASTGRWGGVGVQPQNFPRGHLKNSGQACAVLAQGDLELVRLLYGDPMQVFSSCLRGMIIAPKGKTLDVADYAAIEARVLFWVAKNEPGLEAFREGRDLYKEMAQRVYNLKHVEDVSKDQRWLGKTAILGCGYGMGPERFKGTCLEQGGVEIDDALARTAVYAYRDAHNPVVILWKNLEMAATEAIAHPGMKYTINRTSWWVKDNFLWCELPSGRRLAYHQPSVRIEVNKWKEKKAVIFHYGIHPKTKQWCEQRTWGGVLTENVVQAIARDLMAAAMLRIEATGKWQIVLTVHDELIAERDIFGDGTNKEFCDLMAALPPWAEGCPVQVEGYESIRYRK